MGPHAVKRLRSRPHTSPALRDGLVKPKPVETEMFRLEKRALWDLSLQRPQEHCVGGADSVGSRASVCLQIPQPGLCHTDLFTRAALPAAATPQSEHSLPGPAGAPQKAQREGGPRPSCAGLKDTCGPHVPPPACTSLGGWGTQSLEKTLLSQ